MIGVFFSKLMLKLMLMFQIGRWHVITMMFFLVEVVFVQGMQRPFQKTVDKFFQVDGGLRVPLFADASVNQVNGHTETPSPSFGAFPAFSLITLPLSCPRRFLRFSPFPA